jgi:fatty acid desaturase/predicted heme/steroid binding protein
MGFGTEKAQSHQNQGVKYSMDEVKKHNVPGDAWMVYKNRIYDVSDYSTHPGGNVIFTHAGSDFTDVFAVFHPSSAYDIMEEFCIGELDDESQQTPQVEKLNSFETHEQFMQGYRNLRGKLIAKGLFKASPAYYVWKVVSNFFIFGAAVACVVLSDSFWVHMLGALFLGLFWQQSGWLAHDFLHHQVFKNRTYGDMVGIFIGNFCQGFSGAWWKDKHNAHHAVPNLHASSPEAHDGDPDIDTMPLLAWSLNMARQIQASDVWGQFFIKHQAFLYFPLLLLARIAWVNSAFQFVFGRSMMKWEAPHWDEARQKMKHKGWEKAALFGFLGWMGWLHFQLPLLHILPFFILSQTSAGFMLALVFGVGHNGMATYEAAERPDFWRLQVSTTRNVTSNPLIGWFCGGLQYQVEHHLFPDCPRHSLGEVHKHVEKFCQEHEVTYHEATLWKGSVEVLDHLSDVSEAFIQEFPSL